MSRTKVANSGNLIKTVKMSKNLTFAGVPVTSNIEVSLKKYSKHVSVFFAEHNDDAHAAHCYARENKIKDVNEIVTFLGKRGFLKK